MIKKQINIKVILGLVVTLVIVGFVIVIHNVNNSTNDTDNNNEEEKIDDDNINDEEVSENMQINININDISYTATLEDNETAIAFYNMLPLELEMSELNGNEKYYYLGSSLPSNPVRVNTINTGDLMLFGSDCLVLFYDTFTTSYSYTRIGKLNNVTGLSDIIGSDNVIISFTK